MFYYIPALSKGHAVFYSAYLDSKVAGGISAEPDKSTFWAGLGKTGQDIAKDYAVLNNRSTLEMTMESHGIPLPGNDDFAWHRASSSYAMRSSGVVEALLGKELGNYYGDKLIGANWFNFERILLNINPNVTMIMNTQRVFQFKTFFTGLSSAGESIINALHYIHCWKL